MNKTQKSMTEILPAEKLPECWKDEARINVLFAPFRNRSVNPKDWESKLHFWKNLIYLYCTHHKKYSFTTQELVKIFTKNGKPPACLDIVLDDMHRSGEIKPVEVFLEKPAETWSLWAADILIKKPVLWSFKKVKDVVSPVTNITYIHVKAIEENALELYKNIPDDQKFKALSLKELSDELKLENNDNLRYLLHYLTCQGKVCLKDIQTNKKVVTLIKFCDPKNKVITETDIDVYTLELSEKTLSKSIHKLEEDSHKLLLQTKNFLRLGRKQSAKTCLRKKHETDKTIEKRANTLHNVEILISRLKDADSDQEVFAAYKKALAGLRNSGLNEETVSKTMIQLEEVLDIQKDIQEAMVLTDVANDRELEEELEDLLAEDENSNNAGDIGGLSEDLASLKLVSPPKEPPELSSFEVKKSETKESDVTL